MLLSLSTDYTDFGRFPGLGSKPNPRNPSLCEALSSAKGLRRRSGRRLRLSPKSVSVPIQIQCNRNGRGSQAKPKRPSRNARFSTGIAAALLATGRETNRHNNLGVALQQVGDAAGAEVEFRQALVLQPDLALALNNLGEIVLARNRLDSAEQLFRRAVSSQPGYALAHYNLGVVFQRTSRIADAESEYRRTLELMPGFTDAQERLKEIRPKQ
jgi:Flp pilus assembly protein TadD